MSTQLFLLKPSLCKILVEFTQVQSSFMLVKNIKFHADYHQSLGLVLVRVPSTFLLDTFHESRPVNLGRPKTSGHKIQANEIDVFVG